MLETKLYELLTPTIEGLGYQLWGLEFNANVLRIYLDSTNGINIDDCERASRQIAAILDVEDPIAAKYTLEVSSKGLDCFLFKPCQFAAYIGSNLKIKLRSSFDGRRNFQGLFHNLIDDELILYLDNIEYALPLELIEKAQVIPNFYKGKK